MKRNYRADHRNQRSWHVGISRMIPAIACLSLYPMLTGAHLRTDPNCGLVGVDTAKGIATIRDNTTGRTWQFEAGPATLAILNNGAGIEVDNGGQANIAGVQKAYALNEPESIAPCCTITQIHLAVTNGGIVVRDKATGTTHHVSMSNQAVLGALTVGQNVAMDRSGKWLLVSAESDGKPATFSFPVSAGPKPSQPCCGIIDVDAAGGIVTIRDRRTGLTAQFEAGAQALRAMKVGDDVDVTTGAGPGAPGRRILSVGGVARNYAVSDPASANPCCVVTVINGGVTTVDTATRVTRHIGIDNAAAKSAIKVGQKVSMDPTGKWALFQLNVDGRVGTYSFPVEGAGDVGKTEEAWEIRASPQLKGALGRLAFDYTDKDATGGATIQPAGQTDGNQFVLIGEPVPLPPGKYDILVNGAPVKSVPIESGMETVLRVGVLSVTKGVKAGIYDRSKTKELKFTDGGRTLLPAGTYFLKVNGAFAKVIIRDKQVTDF